MYEEQAARKGVEEVLVMLKGVVCASDELTAKLPESDKSLQAACTEPASLKEQAERTDTDKAASTRVIAGVREEPEQHMVRLNDAFVGRNQADMLSHSLVV